MMMMNVTGAQDRVWNDILTPEALAIWRGISPFTNRPMGKTGCKYCTDNRQEIKRLRILLDDMEQQVQEVTQFNLDQIREPTAMLEAINNLQIPAEEYARMTASDISRL